MANFIADDIDFAEYMDLTEHDQRVIPSGQYAEDVVSYFWDEKRDRGDVLPWEKTLGKIAFRPGEVTLWAGINGHGKSLATWWKEIHLKFQKNTNVSGMKTQ